MPIQDNTVTKVIETAALIAITVLMLMCFLQGEMLPVQQGATTTYKMEFKPDGFNHTFTYEYMDVTT